MLRTGPTAGVIASPASSYAAHRQRVIAAGFPLSVLVVFGLTLFYVVADQVRAPGGWQALTYALQLLIPIAGLVLARGALRRHAETVALATDFAFTAVLAGRLLIPTTTLSGTALFLSLKMLATAVLWPWHPQLQYISAAGTLVLYYAVLTWGGRSLADTHQLAGPMIAAVLSCVGATIADRTRQHLWRQSVELDAAERRTRSLLEGERILAAIAREITVLSDLGTALDRINSLTAAALGCEFSNTYLIDDARRELAGAATNASQPALRAQILAMRGSFELPVVVELLAGRTVVINDPVAQRWFDPAQLARDGIRHLALTPITGKGTVFGVLSITRTSTARPFDQREISLLKAIAAQAAIAIENARLFEGLAKSEASYRALFERATDLIVVLEEDGGLRFANQAALDFAGVDADGLRQLRWQDFVDDAARQRVERRLAVGRRRPDSDRAWEIEVQPPGGTPATLELRTRLISQPGQARIYQCIARDVTERRQQERQTQQLLHRLRESNRVQAEFVANMSHELRTPLNVIIGYADLLGDEPGLPTDGDAPLFLHRISSAGRALHRMVESVLEYARLDRGRNVLIPTHFPASQILRELRDLCADVRGSAAVSLDIQEHADLHFATDYDRLYSVLSNLLLNALKFTAEGRIELSLRRVNLADAEFTVRDTGIGIDAEELAHVFEPFRQVDGSPTRSYGGVGLGLAIVRRNVDLLRGQVEVESQVGVGTTFRVRIPIHVDADAAEPFPASSAA